jgi:putative transposase
MIDREHELSITKQAEVLKISRGSVYYLPRPMSSDNLAIMRRLDQLHLEFPFAGSRMLRGLLAAEGCKIGRRHVKTLMKRMGIEALYRRPRTTKPEAGHKIYPYLLRGMAITRPNQVWAMDITYIPMARGFVYLAVVLDWFSRRVLSWRLSITMEAAFCVETLEDALARHGKPEIFNTDQGSQGRFKRSLQHLYGGKLRWAIGDDIPIEHAGLYCVHQGGHQFHSARIGGSSGR